MRDLGRGPRPDAVVRRRAAGAAGAGRRRAARPRRAAAGSTIERSERERMARPITLFTGQWADLPFEEVAPAGRRVGLRRAGDRLLGRPLRRRGPRSRTTRTSQGRRDILEKHGLQVFAISNHLTGQAVCDDPIDERHQGILPAARLGRRRARGRAAARGRGDEGDGAGPRRRSASTRSSASPARRSGRPWRCSRRCRSRWSTPATATSPTAGTRSSTCSTRSACGSRTRCTRQRDRLRLLDDGARRWRRSGTARRSA